MSKLIIMCGPPGSGKSTHALSLSQYAYVNQDTQGKKDHLKIFHEHLKNNLDIVVDRLNFSKEQRDRYLVPAKNMGYQTEIIVLHESRLVCSERMMKRKDHPTIKNSTDAASALNTFFSKYERPTQDEADVITLKYPEGDKPKCIVIDLDGTLANINHRLHFVQGEGKKDWKNFCYNIPNDTLNEWCAEIIYSFQDRKDNIDIVLASGRSDEHKKLTENWLSDNLIKYNNLFMRLRNDSRKDCVIKEVILDFEILTRYNPLFFIDDRKQVFEMWRKRGFVCLACAEGNF